MVLASLTGILINPRHQISTLIETWKTLLQVGPSSLKLGAMAPHTGAPGRQIVLVLDNGGDVLRIGFAGEPKPRMIVPNCIVRPPNSTVLVADEVLSLNGASKVNFNRPVDRGYVTNWEVQDRVWRRMFKELHVDPPRTVLIVTEAPFAPYQLTGMMNEMIFEEYGFAGCIKVPSATLSAYHYRYSLAQQHRLSTPQSALPDCVTVVDSGFSFTHIIPFYRGRAVPNAVKRINVGGKLLTNLLKETVSFTKVNLMDEFPTANDAKELMCYVTPDLHQDMDTIKHRAADVRKFFLLPDYVDRRKGVVLPPDSELLQGGGGEGDKASATLLMLDVERFSVPEVLFHPSDIDIKQAGVPEAIVQAVQDCDVGLRAALYGNVLLTGGNTKFPGFRERVEKELRNLVPEHYPVQVILPDEPSDYAWKGGSLLGQDGDTMHGMVYRIEKGLQGCDAHFSANW